MSEQETHEEIIAEQLTNIESLGDELPAVIAAGTLRKLLRHLDEAHKREVDALKRRCAELDAEVAAKDEVIKRLNDAIAEDQRRKMATAENSSAVGNTAKLHEVAEFVAHIDDNGYTSHDVQCAINKARAALAEPVKNCEVGTIEDQTRRYEDYCRVHTKVGGCTGCPLIGCRRCQIAWAQLPYVEKEGGTK